jgi:ABC-type uncharacterized transport system permease subunit
MLIRTPSPTRFGELQRATPAASDASLRVPVIVGVVIIGIFFIVAFVFLFVFFLVWLLSKTETGSYRVIENIGVDKLWVFCGHRQMVRLVRLAPL